MTNLSDLMSRFSASERAAITVVVMPLAALGFFAIALLWLLAWPIAPFYVYFKSKNVRT